MTMPNTSTTEPKEKAPEKTEGKAKPQPIDLSKPGTILAPASKPQTDLANTEAYRRLQSERDQATARVQAMEKRLAENEAIIQEIKRDRRKQALGEMGDNPEVQRVLNENERLEENIARLKVAESEATNRQRELEARERLVNSNLKKVEMWELHQKVLQEQGVDIPMEELIPARSYEEMERLADLYVRMAKKGGTPSEEQKGKATEAKKGDKPYSDDDIHLDSGKSRGSPGARRYTAAEIKAMSPQEYAKLEAEGKIIL